MLRSWQWRWRWRWRPDARRVPHVLLRQPDPRRHRVLRRTPPRRSPPRPPQPGRSAPATSAIECFVPPFCWRGHQVRSPSSGPTTTAPHRAPARRRGRSFTRSLVCPEGLWGLGAPPRQDGTLPSGGRPSSGTRRHWPSPSEAPEKVSGAGPFPARSSLRSPQRRPHGGQARAATKPAPMSGC